MTLEELFAPFGLLAPPLEVRGLALDSRRVEPGFVFVAAPGVPLPHRKPLDGHDFIPEALARGAIAVVGERDLTLPVPYLRVADSRLALAQLARRFYGEPDRRLALLGVTASKGKSTTASLLHHLLQGAGVGTALLSTVGLRLGEEARPPVGHFTTPEAPEVYGFLREAADRGLSAAVLEVSSHALALKRVEGLGYRIGVFVSFYPDDHLDLHGTPEAYFAAKALLVARAEVAVLHTGLPHLEGLRSRPHLLVGPGGEVWAQGVREEEGGVGFRLHTPWGQGEVFLPLLGAYNVDNALAAAAAALLYGVPLEGVLQGLATFPGVPGRMEVVQGQPFRVVIDFAHTGKSLEAALSTLRRTTRGRLLLVVGAAGERDPRRREDIGRVAARLADLTFFTEEDHRGEPLEAILQALAQAAEREGGRYALVPDRREAIFRALREARPGDTVLLAGKGHERTLERGGEALPWDEKAVAQEALASLGLG
ncbi:Mur ligase family protein [Thermus sp.]|uniref:Mur ligase family protein n=1 Tax=Thermus sp. TaxID=275 RepID=UPI0025E602B9|nr:UDP-N-acetylmuramoyl-L-alanyl-D-glutamate--2,6-diaminopimelate ligase [Thermus sp.]MCS6868723.1 UDP-N-acetylmuramoyl-L-alanyl-D-glutamate--2,6-diaminopimelate ligase [Thermus sp.]MDW8356670.1 UDP-N-acetylmuramoyl-L-alanyl-D-glutamate--2,6-diaminopimelate ligase [Thermus sp.]